MDKNMIHIDDLIKQRLGNGEEKERPGAWLQMRELLDKEMPVSPPVVFNWRRMLGLVAGVGLLASVGVGGYYVANSLRTDDINDTPVAAVSSPGTNSPANKNNDNTSAIAATGIDKENNTENTTANKNQTTDKKETSSQSKSLVNNNKDNYTASTKSNKAADTKSGTGAAATKPSVTSQTGKTSQNQPSSSSTNTNVAAKETVKPTGTETQKTQVAANKPAAQKTATTAKDPIVAANTQKPAAKGTQSVVPNSSLGNSNNTGKVTAPVQPADNTRSLAVKTDSMNKMNVVQRWDRKNGFSSDTIGTGKMAVERMVSERQKEPATAMKPATAKAEESKQEIVPAASLAANAESKEGELVPLEKYRVSRKKTNKTWDPNRFDEMVRDAKFKLSRVHFYPGILAGGNSTFSQNNLSGFHAGLSGIISFNEKWSVLTELKYMHRFHGGNIQDDYLRSTDTTKTINGVKYASYDSVEHFFNFPTTSAIELPIAIRYAIKRFHLFGGANMVYHFTINNIYEGDRLHPKETAMSVNYTWQKGLPDITISDFSSRFGIGALLGAAYQVSPALQVDLRLTKSVWDNASTPGAKAVSRSLYNAPSMQMTVTYRLNGNRPGPKKAQ